MRKQCKYGLGWETSNYNTYRNLGYIYRITEELHENRNVKRMLIGYPRGEI